MRDYRLYIKDILMEEPELRDEFILRMKDIELEKSIPLKNSGKDIDWRK